MTPTRTDSLEHATGYLTVDPSGTGTVTSPTGDGLRIDRTALGEALHGDEVRIELLRPGAARIVASLARRPRRLVGVVDAGRWFLCDDERFPRALRIDAGALTEESVCGAELLASVVAAGKAEVRLARVFGSRGSLRAETEALLWRESIEAGASPDGDAPLGPDVRRELEALRRTVMMIGMRGREWTGRVHDGHVELDELGIHVRCRAGTPIEAGARVVVRIDGVSLGERVVHATLLRTLS